MFYSKKICLAYTSQFNIEFDSTNFDSGIFFEVSKQSFNFLIECLQDKNEINEDYNVEYLCFNTKIRNAIHSQLLKYCKNHGMNVNKEDELMDNSLTKIFIYNNELKKTKASDEKTIIENIFLYFYCGIFALKAYSKENFEEVLIHNIRLFGIDQQLNKLVDRVTFLERTQITLMIISYVNWVIGLVNEFTNNHFNIRTISIQGVGVNANNKEMTLEINGSNNVIIQEQQEPFRLTFDKLKGLKEYFDTKIVGQPQVIEKINEILIGEMYNLNKKGHRPIGTLFFVGPTGVGKTETVKELAKFLYGTERIHRFDMSEYKSEVAIQKLIGAPNGYVGYQEGGTLTNAMQRNPNTIVLFDEIEKADRTVFDLFLQMIDEGFVTSNKGVKSYFDNTIIVFTSNLGVSNLTARMGFENIQEIVKENVQYFFEHTINRPELLGRIGTDNIVVFNLIDKKEDLYKILDIMFNNFKEEYDDSKIVLNFNREQVYDKILENIDLTKGARDIRNKFELFKKHLYAGFFMKELNPQDMKNMTIEFTYDGKNVNITNIDKKS